MGRWEGGVGKVAILKGGMGGNAGGLECEGGKVGEWEEVKSGGINVCLIILRIGFERSLV